ncbi:MAG: amidohydrolase [bacterium]
MNDLTITLIQTNLFWEEAARNLKHFDQLISGISTSPDLILLPEMFNTGFSINPQKCAETMTGPSMAFLKENAREKQAVIMATLLIEENQFYYNRLVAVFPDGTTQHYDKRHLFRLSEEYKIFKGGKDPLIIEVKGWKIRPLICYDLRFPVWSKNSYVKGEYAYDLLVYLANWPNNRSNVWKTLLSARAMENQACVAGLNRVGDDGFGTFHSGDSSVLDAKGQPLVAATPSKEEVISATLSGADLSLFRESFTLGLDWDKFTIHH